MTEMAMSRRYLLAAAGAGVALAGASGVACGRGTTQGSSPHEEFLRTWYGAWQKTDWTPVDAMTTDDFTFTSAAGDDHISKATFKSRCWENQKGLVDSFEMQQVFGSGDEALVKYRAKTKAGKSFQNVEYFRFRDGKIAALECYFGQENSFPSAVNASQKG